MYRLEIKKGSIPAKKAETPPQNGLKLDYIFKLLHFNYLPPLIRCDCMIIARLVTLQLPSVIPACKRLLFVQTIGCLQAVRRDDCHILCGNNSSICMHNTILGLCKGTDRQHKKQTCENKFIYSPHSLIQPGYWKSQLRQPSLIRTYVLFCFLMIQSCSSSSRLRDSTIDFKA